jgi:hypothetical protein
VLGIDCEMCETVDPVTGVKNPLSLVRLSVVNGLNPKEVMRMKYFHILEDCMSKFESLRF